MDRSPWASSAAAASRVRIAHSRNGRSAVITVAGELDVLTSPQLEEAIDAVLVTNPPIVIVDLTAVEFLSSSAISVLVAARDRAAKDSRFAVVADSPATSRPIRLTGIDKLIELFPTLDVALTALEA